MRGIRMLSIAWAVCVAVSPIRASATDHLAPEGWNGDNAARLAEMITSLGKASPDHDPAAPPVAVFDWDNTVIKNDIGDATAYWMIDNGKILVPAEGDWKRTSDWMTDAGAAALAAACPVADGQRTVPAPGDARCADELYELYEHARTTSGVIAFRQDGYDHRAYKPEYSWLAQLLAGYTPEEIRGFATQARDEHLAAPVGATQTVGTHGGLPAYIRIYEPIRDLIARLQFAGFDVWIVSASPQPFVEPFAAMVGIEADHVVGIRSVLDGEGRITADLQGCGTSADGDDAVMTYRAGKRCWINQAIFGLEGPEGLQPHPDEARRIAFGAGDAVTDLEFIQDATALRLVIDRHKDELMCHALHDADGRWIVEPMFIEPRPALTEPYPCATRACTSADGQPVPCTGPGGEVIPDQGGTRP